MKIILLPAIAILAGALPARADWIAGRDLIANELPDGPQELLNPNAAVPEWSYGYRSALAGTAFTPFVAANHTNAAGSSPLVQGWTVNDRTAAVNTGAVPVIFNFGTGPLSQLNPGEMILHPSLVLEYTLVRWTAPAAGSYALSASWQDIDLHGGDGASGNVVVNGTPIFAQSFGNGGQTSTTQTVTLSAGDLVDFALGANGDYLFDATRFNAVIVPEPSALALLLGALLPVFCGRRKSAEKSRSRC